jgi:hypothetical protein
MVPEPLAPRREGMHPALRLLLFLVLVFLFLVSIKLMGSSIKALGKETALGLFEGIQNPFAGLAVGILATVLVQSSSVTTATIVAMVGSGTLPVETAVPMVMGANIGTSITNTIVALATCRRARSSSWPSPGPRCTTSSTSSPSRSSCPGDPEFGAVLGARRGLADRGRAGAGPRL